MIIIRPRNEHDANQHYVNPKRYRRVYISNTLDNQYALYTTNEEETFGEDLEFLSSWLNHNNIILNLLISNNTFAA